MLKLLLSVAPCFKHQVYVGKLLNLSRTTANGSTNRISRPCAIHNREYIRQIYCPSEVCSFSKNSVEGCSHTTQEKVGVLLLNLGGPETLSDVQPFLFNLFADPDIIRLPGLFRLFQWPLAFLMALLRAPKSKQGYAAIGGGSPLRRITDEQAHALKMALEAKNVPANVYVGMRYWHSFTEEAVSKKSDGNHVSCYLLSAIDEFFVMSFKGIRLEYLLIKKDGVTKLVVLPLYPQFSISTSGSSIRLLQSLFRRDPYFTMLPVSIIESWYERDGYVKSMADLIEKELQKFPDQEEVIILFSAHGVPISYVEDAGDPYRDQTVQSVSIIMEELKARGVNSQNFLAYQSRVGPVEWLKPYTDEVIVELGQKGMKSVLVVPVSFVSEHIETLEEIDMEYKHLATESGIQNWGRVPALGCTPPFIGDLADAVIDALPLAKAMETVNASSIESFIDSLKPTIKLLFGSIIAFFILLYPRLISLLRSQHGWKFT